MQLLVSLTTFFSLSCALPIVNVASMPTGVQAHPAIHTYNDAANQLAKFITEVKQFNWKTPRTDIIYRQGIETLETLRRGNREVIEGPGLDTRATNTLTPALLTLNTQTHQMASTVKDRRSDIERGNAGLVVYSLLKQTYDVCADMRKYFVEKMPRTIGTPIIDEMLNTISGARDIFKPAGGDVAVVVVTQPELNTASTSPTWSPAYNRNPPPACGSSRAFR
jgi:hypothetical protein